MSGCGGRATESRSAAGTVGCGARCTAHSGLRCNRAGLFTLLHGGDGAIGFCRSERSLCVLRQQEGGELRRGVERHEPSCSEGRMNSELAMREALGRAMATPPLLRFRAIARSVRPARSSIGNIRSYLQFDALCSVVLRCLTLCAAVPTAAHSPAAADRAIPRSHWVLRCPDSFCLLWISRPCALLVALHSRFVATRCAIVEAKGRESRRFVECAHSDRAAALTQLPCASSDSTAPRRSSAQAPEPSSSQPTPEERSIRTPGLFSSWRTRLRSST